MEHRYGRRIDTNEKVLIYRGGLLVAIGRLRNIGRYGLFVESEYADVALNQPLEIELLSRSSSATRHDRCRIAVVHKTENGFGVAVCEESNTSYDVLMARMSLGVQSDRAVDKSYSAPLRSDVLLHSAVS